MNQRRVISLRTLLFSLAGPLLVLLSASPLFAAQGFDGVLRSNHADGSVHSSNLPLDVTLINGSSRILPATLKLAVNGQDVSAAARISGTAFGAAIHYVFSPRLPREAHVDYQVSFKVDGTNAGPFSVSVGFDTDVRGPGDFSIEVEDFDYGGGRSRPESNAPGYTGGAYQDRGGQPEVDFHLGANGSDNGSDYRDLGSTSLPLVFSDQQERSGYLLEQNWILLGSAGDWFNYTRFFPTNSYRVFAALSHGNTELGGLAGSLVDPGDVFELGIFRAPGNGAWGVDVLVPLLDTFSGAPVELDLGGTTTLRYVCRSGAADYLLFVPVVRFTSVTVGQDRISLSWTGDAVLGGASDVAGPYQAIPGIAGSPASIPLSTQPGGQFFRLMP